MVEGCCQGQDMLSASRGMRLLLPAGARPLLKDWEMHLTTIFPEVRLKRYMEMRGGDGGPPHMIAALPAFWVGLLYDRYSADGPEVAGVAIDVDGSATAGLMV